MKKVVCGEAVGPMWRNGVGEGDLDCVFVDGIDVEIGVGFNQRDKGVCH